jgi:hypothetical protein
METQEPFHLMVIPGPGMKALIRHFKRKKEQCMEPRAIVSRYFPEPDRSIQAIFMGQASPDATMVYSVVASGACLLQAALILLLAGPLSAWAPLLGGQALGTSAKPIDIMADITNAAEIIKLKKEKTAERKRKATPSTSDNSTASGFSEGSHVALIGAANYQHLKDLIETYCPRNQKGILQVSGNHPCMEWYHAHA